MTNEEYVRTCNEALASEFGRKIGDILDSPSGRFTVVGYDDGAMILRRDDGTEVAMRTSKDGGSLEVSLIDGTRAASFSRALLRSMLRKRAR